jgi:hypothetical protein
MDETDVRIIGWSSRSFCGARDVLIVVEDVVRLLLCAVDHGEEDDDLHLSFLLHEGVR